MSDEEIKVMFMRPSKLILLALVMFGLIPSAHAVTLGELGEIIGDSVFNATKEGLRSMILEEAGMTDLQDTGNNYQANQDSLMGLFYWGIVSNPDPMKEGGKVKGLWNAIFYLSLLACGVYVSIIGIMYMIPKYSVGRVQESGFKKALAEKRLEYLVVGLFFMFMSYYIYGFLVYTNIQLVGALNLDMASFILSLLSGGHFVAMVLVILLFFVLSLLLIYRYFIVWLGPIPFTIGLAMKYMDGEDDPGIIGRMGASLISYSVGMIFVQFIVAFYMYLMIMFYEANMDKSWLFKEVMVIGICVGGVLLFFKVIGFMSSTVATRLSKVVVSTTPVGRAIEVYKGAKGKGR